MLSHLSVSLVDTREVDFGHECQLGRDVGIVWAAVDLHTVDAVLVNAL